MRKVIPLLIGGLLLIGIGDAKGKRKESAERSTLDRYIEAASQGQSALGSLASPGSLFQPTSRMAELGRDFRAQNVDDLVTILVSDRASAVSKGTTSSSRKSSVNYGINAIFGPVSAANPLGKLAGATGDNSLQGQGETTRSTVLNTTLTARVTHVLPNGNLVVHGLKEVAINSERQLIEVRGVVRPDDLTGANSVFSDRVGMLTVRVNGKGVVGDAIRRPFFLYRLLLGLLPL